MTPNPWDSLSEHFNSKKNLAEVDTDAADNILIAWPKIIEKINSWSKGKTNISFLDYGCGTGTFCEKLRQLGHQNIIGMDSSVGMIERASKNYGKDITFTRGSADNALSIKPVDVITGVMVFQFIPNIDEVLKNLTDILKPGGLFIFAVHNPETVQVSLQRGKAMFSHFEAIENVQRGLLHLGGNPISIFIRAASEYERIMSLFGIQKISEDYPRFTQKFISKYGTDLPEDVPEYMILGFKK